MFNWLKSLIRKARECNLVEETRIIRGPESDIEPAKVIDDLSGSRANAYLALWLKADITQEKMPQYKRVEQFIIKWIDDDPSLSKPLESVNLHATDEMIKFARQFNILGYKCSDTALVDYLKSLL